ncbi:MAG: hypothetical protein WAS54_03300 [Scrofimicrobium sp.]
MSQITASEVAMRLGVTKRRALDLLRTEVIAGVQLGNGVWLADSDSIARYEVLGLGGSGRTLDSSTAWGVLWELSGMDSDWLSVRTRARVRKRIRESDATSIAAAVSGRTKAHRFDVANVERASEGLIRTGRSVVGAIGDNLIEDSQTTAGYVRTGSVEEYAKSHFMIRSLSGQHVLYDNTLPVEYDGDTMPLAVVAADLSRSTDVRERSAGLRGLERLRQKWLGDH